MRGADDRGRAPAFSCLLQVHVKLPCSPPTFSDSDFSGMRASPGAASHVVLTTFFSFPPAQHPLGARDQEYINFPRLELSLYLTDHLIAHLNRSILRLGRPSILKHSTAVINQHSSLSIYSPTQRIYMTQTTGYYILHTANIHISLATRLLGLPSTFSPARPFGLREVSL